MARKKKAVSQVLNKARTRLAAIRSIDPKIDLGNGITAEAYEAEIDKADDGLETYNTQLSLVDLKMGDFKKLEKTVADLSKKVLSAVGNKYGYDSDEYEQAGGVRTSKRKKPTKKKTA